MEAKEQAEYLISEFSLNIMGEIGHKLSMSEVIGIAKRLAITAVNKILSVLKDYTVDYFIQGTYEYYEDVKKELEAYGQDK